STPEVSEGVAQIVLKAMAKDPADRFQSCAQFLAAIDAVQRPPVTPRSRVLIVALVAAIVASVGVIVYLSTQPPTAVVIPDGRPGTGETSGGSAGTGEPSADDAARKAELERERIALVHQSAYDAIVRGSERAAAVCMQLQIRSRKQTAGLSAARSLRDTNVEDQLRRQIEEHTANIADALKTYGAYVDQLTQIDPAIVTEEFDHFGKSLDTSNARQVQMAHVMKRDYEARRRGARPVDEKVMTGDCIAA